MDHLDFELKQVLQDWAEQQPLPVGGKSRLIKSAAGFKEKGRKNSSRNFTSQPTDLLSWAMVYCVDRRISMARIIT
ncbi:MAG: hypothetical protein WBG94_15665 [Anaerolineales bacterium]